MDSNNNQDPFDKVAADILSPLQSVIEGIPKILKFGTRLPTLGSITDIGGRSGVKMRWPAETVRVMQLVPKEGIFLTGIEGSDPWVEGQRRNQLKEAFDFEANYEQRLERIRGLGIRWLRFGMPYSEVHIAPGQYNFELMDKVVAKCNELGITILADLLHFGLPDWMHENSVEYPYFQNKGFPEVFAQYVTEFTRRYPAIQYFTIVNEPYVTAYFSAKRGIWNETRASAWEDDRDLVRATINIARAAILGKEAVERVWEEEQRSGEPLFLQNDSFESAHAAPGSGRETEAQRINTRRFAALDLIFGKEDDAMYKYLVSQGMAEQEYQWFMTRGNTKGVILGIDHYPACTQILEADGTVNTGFDLNRYQLYELTKLYWHRYRLPLLHTETNAREDTAEAICKKTYEDLRRLQDEGYPVVGMGWYGDEYQVGWHSVLSGPQAFEEHPVGLHYKGQPQPVALIFRELSERGLPQSSTVLEKSLELPIKVIRRMTGIREGLNKPL